MTSGLPELFFNPQAIASYQLPITASNEGEI
jgi:hypothetical protein